MTLFITDDKTPTTNNTINTTDLNEAMSHPRAKMITISPDGDIFIELSDVVVTKDEIIRKTDGLHKANKTGFRGVSVSGNKYRSDISKDGQQTFLGYYDSFSEAVEARLSAEMEASL
tara:strand:- start:318 stop:668 length:351 start_codon:yes stop_codon:yes gene_type:complete